MPCWCWSCDSAFAERRDLFPFDKPFEFKAVEDGVRAFALGKPEHVHIIEQQDLKKYSSSGSAWQGNIRSRSEAGRSGRKVTDTATGIPCEIVNVPGRSPGNYAIKIVPLHPLPAAEGEEGASGVAPPPSPGTPPGSPPPSPKRRKVLEERKERKERMQRDVERGVRNGYNVERVQRESIVRSEMLEPGDKVEFALDEDGGGKYFADVVNESTDTVVEFKKLGLHESLVASRQIQMYRFRLETKYGRKFKSRIVFFTEKDEDDAIVDFEEILHDYQRLPFGLDEVELVYMTDVDVENCTATVNTIKHARMPMAGPSGL